MIKLISMLFVSLLLIGCGYEIDPRTLSSNRQGNEAMGDKRFTDAQGFYIEALGVDPFISEIHSNLGLTYLELKKPEDAIKSFESAEKFARKNEPMFVARFNQGVTRGANKQIEEALQAYQRALDVNPQSMEVKTNIELLLSQQSGQGEGKGQGQNSEDGKGDQESEDQEKKKDQPKDYSKDPQQPYKPREFDGELSEADVKKILGELKQQEQKIRGQFYRNEKKERPRDKDW
jgi:Ca-activated chloride channel family protein